LNVISLKGWDRFQHYKDRDPPWVKLYRDLLTSESWVLGTDLSRLVQVASVLLAARYNNQIPHRWDLIRKVSSLECTEKAFTEALRHLAANNFLEIKEASDVQTPELQSASNMLATCSSEAEQRQSREEREGESCAQQSRAPTATRLPSSFELTPERRAIAEAEKAEPDREFASFTDYWRAASGAKSRKHDWDATWRNWCRRAADFKRPQTNGHAPTPVRTWRPDPADDVPQMKDPYARQ
jgi:hypothetical protein